MTVTTFVRADRLFLASKFQSTEGTQFYLHGVFIEAADEGGAKLVATDGRRVAVFFDNFGFTNKACTVGLPKIAKTAYGSIKKANRQFAWFGIINSGVNETTGKVIAALWCSVEGGTPDEAGFELIRDDMHNPRSPHIIWSGSVDLIEGDFPDYRRVIPRTRPRASEPAAFQLRYLRGFAEIAQLDSASHGVKIIGDNLAEPALVDCGRDDFLGVLMPMAFTCRAVQERDGVFAAPDWALSGSMPPKRNAPGTGDGNEFTPDTV